MPRNTITYPLHQSVSPSLPPHWPATIQPSWQLGYPNRATVDAAHGMTNAGSSVTTAANKADVIATASIKSPMDFTDPTTGRIVLEVNGANWLLLKPIGLGGDGVSIPMAVWAWREIFTDAKNRNDILQWTADAIVHFSAVTCAKTGVSGGRISELWRYCDTFSSEVYRGLNTTGFGTTEHPTAADDAAAYCYFDIGGAQHIEIEGAKNTLTAWNFLYAMI